MSLSAFRIPLAVATFLSIIIQQKWAIMILITLLATPTVVEDTIGPVCDVPGFPSVSTSFICRFVLSRERNLGEAGTPPVPKLNTVQDLLVRSFFSKEVTSADLSIGNMSFLVESSGMGCQEIISGAINQLKEESILMTGDLLELSAKTSYHLNL